VAKMKYIQHSVQLRANKPYCLCPQLDICVCIVCVILYCQTAVPQRAVQQTTSETNVSDEEATGTSCSDALAAFTCCYFDCVLISSDSLIIFHRYQSITLYYSTDLSSSAVPRRVFIVCDVCLHCNKGTKLKVMNINKALLWYLGNAAT